MRSTVYGGTTPLTLAEYERLPDPEQRFGIVRGMVVREPRPGWAHGWVQASIARRLGAYVAERGLGEVVTAVGFVLSAAPPTVRAPDVAFVAKARAPAGAAAAGHPHLAPDLIVEVVSPNERAAELHEKVVEFLEAGTREAWVVYTRARQVVVFRSLSAVAVLGEAHELDGGDVVPGFTATVADLLDG